MKLIPIEFLHTLYMVFASFFLASLIGFPIGALLITARKGVKRPLEVLINIGRSFPFAILMVALIPFTRLIVGTSLGTTASIVPLTIAAIPFAARLVEMAFKEVDRGIIEAALVMGLTRMQIIIKVYIPETLPTLILGGTSLIIHLIGYSAMVGFMGGGGLGKVAIQYGYYQFDLSLMMVTVALLILLVQIIQMMGTKWAHSLYRQRGSIFSK